MDLLAQRHVCFFVPPYRQRLYFHSGTRNMPQQQTLDCTSYRRTQARKSDIKQGGEEARRGVGDKDFSMNGAADDTQQIYGSMRLKFRRNWPFLRQNMLG